MAARVLTPIYCIAQASKGMLLLLVRLWNANASQRIPGSKGGKTGLEGEPVITA